MYKREILIPNLIQIYTVKWYQKYILYPVQYITEEIIHRKFYYTSTCKYFQKEVKECETCQGKKRPTKNMVDFLLSNMIKTLSTLYVDIIGPYKICSKIKYF